MNGVFIPDIALNTSPAFSADQAAERAIADVVANPPQNELTGAALDVSGSIGCCLHAVRLPGWIDPGCPGTELSGLRGRSDEWQQRA